MLTNRVFVAPALLLLVSLAAGCGAPESSPPTVESLVTLAERGEHQRVHRLLSDGASPDVLDACRWTPLMKASLNGHLETVDRLLLFGADVHATDKGGYTALMLAASNDHVEVMVRLLDAGARIDQRERTQGFTALIWAAKQGHERALRVLRERGADESIVDFDGRSAADWEAQVQG
ncbi:MAG: ankyrin repeat domain-containing protein [Gammaproteobacteria bacterium]